MYFFNEHKGYQVSKFQSLKDETSPLISVGVGVVRMYCR